MSNFLSIDDSILINERCVRWVKKMDECMYVCDKLYGCKDIYETYKICKETNPMNYEVWSQKFQERNFQERKFEDNKFRTR